MVVATVTLWEIDKLIQLRHNEQTKRMYKSVGQNYSKNHIDLKKT